MALKLFTRTLRNFSKKYWFPPGFNQDLLKDFDHEKLHPKEIKKEMEAMAGGYGEIRDRPEFPPYNLKVIEYDPADQKYKINDHLATDYFEDDFVILVGIIGAFVPECTEQVVYDWALAASSFKERFLIGKVVVVTRNDPYVTLKFAQKLGYEENLAFLADWDGKFTEISESACELEMELGTRNFRYLGFAFSGNLKVVSKCGYSDTLYTSCVHPAFLWQRFMKKVKIPYYLN